MSDGTYRVSRAGYWFNRWEDESRDDDRIKNLVKYAVARSSFEKCEQQLEDAKKEYRHFAEMYQYILGDENEPFGEACLTSADALGISARAVSSGKRYLEEADQFMVRTRQVCLNDMSLPLIETVYTLMQDITQDGHDLARSIAQAGPGTEFHELSTETVTQFAKRALELARAALKEQA